MRYLKAEKMFDYLLYLALVLVPLIYLPGVTLHFELPKIVLFRVLTLLMLFFFTLKMVQCREIKVFSIFRRPVFKKLIIFFLLVLGISTALSIAPRVSFWGSYYRMQGAFMWLHYFLFFILLVLNLHSRNQWRSAFKFLLTGFVLSFLLAFFQYFDFGFYKHAIWESFPKRVFSSFGNPNYFAYYIVLVFFPLLSFPKKKLWTVVLVGLTLFVLYATKSRGAFLGFISGFTFYLILYGTYLKKKKIIYAGIFLPILVIAVFAGSNIFSLNNRLLLSGENLISVETRLIIWGNSLRMIDDRPLFGHGPETFSLAFEEYASPELLDLDNSVDIPDKAYNVFIELAANVGFLGLLLFVMVFATIFKYGFASLREVSKKRKIEIIGILSAFLSLFVADLVGFSVTVHFMTVAFLLAYFLFLISEKSIKKCVVPLRKRSLRVFTVAFVSVFVISSIILQDVFYLVADYYANEGVKALDKGDANAVVQNFYNANLYQPDQSYYNYFLASIFYELGEEELSHEYLEKGGRFDSYNDDFYYKLSEKLANN